MSIIETELNATWEGAEWKPVYHASGFTFLDMPVVTQASPRKLQPMSWGLIPHWVKSAEQAHEMRGLTLNARSESLFEKPSFRKSAQQKRCLIPSDGFFEWMEHKGNKYPHYIQMSSGSVFCFGGIYDQWLNPVTGQNINSFSIITTTANSMMARIHNRKKRMPLIIPSHKWQDWLDSSADKKMVESFFQPLSDESLQAYTISKRITDRFKDSNVPQTLDSFVYPELEY